MSKFLLSRTAPLTPRLRTAAMLSALMLASCQTSADEVMSLGDAAQLATAGGKAAAKTEGYVDPIVVAAGSAGTKAAAPSANGELPLYEPSPGVTASKTSTMAAAYADIAEPPPEVMAVTQQPQAADLGQVIMQPARVDAGNNSLFSASASAPAVMPTDTGATAGSQPTDIAASSSIVPSDMPTMKINAMSKSLFSPSAQQQQGIVDIPADALPLTEAEATAGTVAVAPVAEEDGPPVLKRLSDPRPKRKMLSYAPASATAPAPAIQGQAGASTAGVDPGEAAIPVGADATEATPAEQQKKNKFMSSLRRMLTGGKKTEAPKL
ncbi:hypothetical protein [Rhizobium sp. SL42]|uniref:hypothetical protein n=1 Tax=Rhizobium sp. SL42 TaxID=2806346 RepID=UPI001F3637FE|nr:hypothetical protein [Rhizobium sp. SL42]UJW73573.1 hypothetical protein IM739_11730 [Rhizobium sp. SL42]